MKQDSSEMHFQLCNLCLPESFCSFSVGFPVWHRFSTQYTCQTHFFQLLFHFSKGAIKIPGVYRNRSRGVAQSLRALGCAVIYTAIWGRLSTCTCLASHKSRSLCCTPRCIPSLGDRDRKGQHQIKKEKKKKNRPVLNIQSHEIFIRFTYFGVQRGSRQE